MLPKVHLSTTEQDILILFSFWSLLIFVTGAIASLLVRIFQPFLLNKVNRMKCLQDKHFR